ncbi:hypothetical protein GNI_058550 [Gregarina niphandrodes]|uniref:Uncharacterized protein n=1 Tax=Gregarina niphandrodes TaxID=110365 RepID=A0A023B8Q4_GRENI|nr:hypothetical protein GNI_058550 [Gregarina niphandrodes]EZG69351.1 hypothetical protein GNI_058550 [Gregarina niphandrodes]|eukprot:XP_011134445.1 hypothetical protein GNI_058550 [Gregarina niphandrodes]
MRGDASKASWKGGLGVVLAAFIDRHGGLSTTKGCGFYRVTVVVPDELVHENDQLLELIVASKTDGLDDPDYNIFKYPNKLQLAPESEFNRRLDDAVLDQFVEFMCRSIIRHSRGKLSKKLRNRLVTEVAALHGSKLQGVSMEEDSVPAEDAAGPSGDAVPDLGSLESLVECPAKETRVPPGEQRPAKDSRRSLNEVPVEKTPVDLAVEEGLLKVLLCEPASEYEFWVSDRLWKLEHPEDEVVPDEVVEKAPSAIDENVPQPRSLRMFGGLQWFSLRDFSFNKFRLEKLQPSNVIERIRCKVASLRQCMEDNPKMTVVVAAGMLSGLALCMSWHHRVSVKEVAIPTINSLVCEPSTGFGDQFEVWPSFECLPTRRPCDCRSGLDCEITDMMCQSATGPMHVSWGIPKKIRGSDELLKWLACRARAADFEFEGPITTTLSNPEVVGTEGLRFSLTVNNRDGATFRHNVVCCPDGCRP